MKIHFKISGLSTDSVKDAFREAAKVPLGHEYKEWTLTCGICGKYLDAHAPIDPKEVEALLSREDYMRAIMECSY